MIEVRLTRRLRRLLGGAPLFEMLGLLAAAMPPPALSGITGTILDTSRIIAAPPKHAKRKPRWDPPPRPERKKRAPLTGRRPPSAEEAGAT
ncbi:MAG: hypothetical protein AB1430_09205 [Pseudomonadota bacterium]